MRGVFIAIEVYKSIAVEAIRKGNAEPKQIAPNGYFNDLLLGTDKNGNYKEIPSRIMDARPWFTGTGFAIEAKGKAFQDKIEKEFHNPDANKKQTLIYYVRKEDIGAKNLMHLFEQGFRGDCENLLQLINAKTKKQILTVEELHDADEIILKVVGDIRTFKLTEYNGGNFEAVGKNDSTNIWASDNSALGLLQRGDGGFGYGIRRLVCAFECLDVRRGVVFLDDLKQLAAKAAKDVTDKTPQSIKDLIAAVQNQSQ